MLIDLDEATERGSEFNIQNLKKKNKEKKSIY